MLISYDAFDLGSARFVRSGTSMGRCLDDPDDVATRAQNGEVLRCAWTLRCEAPVCARRGGDTRDLGAQVSSLARSLRGGGAEGPYDHRLVRATAAPISAHDAVGSTGRRRMVPVPGSFARRRYRSVPRAARAKAMTRRAVALAAPDAAYLRSRATSSHVVATCPLSPPPPVPLTIPNSSGAYQIVCGQSMRSTL